MSGFDCRQSPEQAERLGASLDDVRTVGQPVDQRLSEAQVGEFLPPLGERQVVVTMERGANIGERHGLMGS
jgi:hypothetical protein